MILTAADIPETGPVSGHEQTRSKVSLPHPEQMSDRAGLHMLATAGRCCTVADGRIGYFTRDSSSAPFPGSLCTAES